MFSDAVTKTEPRNLLMITGAWEGFLRADALKNARLVDPAATEDETLGDPARNTGRRAVVAPDVEHVSVLYSATALREARSWLDAVFGRTSSGPVAATGGWIVLLLAGVVVLAWPLAGLLPKGERLAPTLPLKTFLIAVLVPAVVTPLVLSRIDTHFLPVLVADYLAVHLFVYGVLSLGLLFWKRRPRRPRGVAQRVRARRLRHCRFRRRARSLCRLLHAQSGKAADHRRHRGWSSALHALRQPRH